MAMTNGAIIVMAVDELNEKIAAINRADLLCTDWQLARVASLQSLAN
jgi:uncharacterized small protein (DUF1192 family)